MIIHISIFFTLFTLSVQRELFGGSSKTVIYGCQYSLKNYRFGCLDDGFWDCTCNYEPKTTSLLNCIEDYSPSFFNDSVSHLQRFCLDYGGFNVTMDELERRFKNNTDLVNYNHVVYDNSTVYQGIIPLTNVTQDYKESYDSYYYNFDISPVYGTYMVHFWVVVISFLSILNYTSKHALFSQNKYINAARQTVIPIFKSHSEPYNFSIYKFQIPSIIPTKLESIIILAYLFLNTYYITIYDTTPHTNFFPTRMIQMTKYVSDRTGIISFCQLPVIIVFMMRNNVLIELTGLNYNSFIQFHKWVSRSMVFNALVHSYGYFLYFWLLDELDDESNKLYFKYGKFAMSIGLFVVFSSIFYLRQFNYELFLVGHIILAFFFLIGCIIHCLSFGYLEYIYASLAIWGLDKSIRVWKMYQNGIINGVISLNQSTDLSYTITLPINAIKFYPGCYVYVNFLTRKLNWWESHPFTIMNSITTKNEIKIIIKPKEGMTGEVLSSLKKSLTNSMNVKLLIEGPYGVEHDFNPWKNALIISGGYGIPGPITHFYELSKNQSPIQSTVKLIWIVKNWNDLNIISTELIQLNEQLNPNFMIEIYITRSVTKSINHMSKYSNVNFIIGRPDLAKQIKDFKRCCESPVLISCGSSLLCDSIRHILTDVKGYELVEELQVW